jgi:hypothetical protein
MSIGEYLRRFDDMGGENPELLAGPLAGSTDVLSAGKVVLGVVRKKWELRVALIERVRKAKAAAMERLALQQVQLQQGIVGEVAVPVPGLDLGVGGVADVGVDDDLDMGVLDPMVLDKTMHGCPMMDGSLEAYYSIWDETFSASGMAGSAGDHTGGVPGGIPGVTGPPLPTNEYVDLWGNMTAGWARWQQQPGGFPDVSGGI